MRLDLARLRGGYLATAVHDLLVAQQERIVQLVEDLNIPDRARAAHVKRLIAAAIRRGG